MNTVLQKELNAIYESRQEQIQEILRLLHNLSIILVLLINQIAKWKQTDRQTQIGKTKDFKIWMRSMPHKPEAKI